MELLEISAGRGEIDEVKRLIQQQRVDVNTTNKDNKTALFYACANGHTDVAKYLLDSGASVRVGETSLTVACVMQNVELVCVLLNHGADPNLASTSRHEDSKHRLPLFVAVHKQNSELAGLLLKRGANVNVTDITGNTALHIAIEHYSHKSSPHLHENLFFKSDVKEDVIDVLLENKADVNFLNRFGETPLYSAVFYTMIGVVSKMVQVYGGNPNKGSPLIAACLRENVELVDMLLRHGADPNLPSMKGYQGSNDMPLFLAAERGKSDIVMSLLNAGASVNALNYKGRNVVCFVAEN